MENRPPFIVSTVHTYAGNRSVSICKNTLQMRAFFITSHCMLRQQMLLAWKSHHGSMATTCVSLVHSSYKTNALNAVTSLFEVNIFAL